MISTLTARSTSIRRPRQTSRKRHLSIESLESRLNLSGLGSLGSVVAQAVAAKTANVAQRSPLVKVMSLTEQKVAPAITSAVDMTSLFGDTTVTGSGTTLVPVTDYSAISNARVEYTGGGNNIGYMSPSGVNLEYKLNVSAPGTYALNFKVASTSWGSFDVFVDGARAAQYSVSPTGSWSTYNNTSQQVWLGSGNHTLRIAPTWGSVFNIREIGLSPVSVSLPSTQNPTTPTTSGGAVTVGSSAAITADKYTAISNSRLEWANGTPDIGYLSPNGGYVEYTLNVQTAGTYSVKVNAASTGWFTFDAQVNGSQGANYESNATGSWSNYQGISRNIWLPSGTVKLRLASKWNSTYNIGTIQIDQAASTPTTPTTPAAPPPVADSWNSGGNVTTSATWMTSFHQLNVVGSAGNDSIYVSQSGDTLSINANGKTTTYSASLYGDMFIKGGEGNDSITVDSSVRLDARIYGDGGSDTLINRTQGKGTIVSIGGGWDALTGNGWATSFWADASDQVNASGAEWNGKVHQVSSFYGGVSTELSGQNFGDPAGTGSTTRLTSSSLWGKGPKMEDVKQGSVSDCYYLAPLQTLAYAAPDRLRELAVDLGDGTYAVQFKRGGTTTYVRVDGDLPTGGWPGGLNYAHPTASGNQWMPIMEKAYAFFRTGAASYSSLVWGNFNAVFGDLGVGVTGVNSSDANSLFNSIQAALSAGKGVTIGTPSSVNSGAPLIASHAYTATSAWRDAWGTQYITLRNPWGFDGAGSDSNTGDAFVTLTAAQLKSNMTASSILA